MRDITALFSKEFYPLKLLAFYTTAEPHKNIYVESFDICPRKKNAINAHPLTIKESQSLAAILSAESQAFGSFLKPKGLMPLNVLHTSPGPDGYALWYTEATITNLFFSPVFKIPNGKAGVPALLWRASMQELKIFALASNEKPSLKTTLYNAPFFNISENGSVCMGTVDIDFTGRIRLEDFMSAWQSYFFNSYFSHYAGTFNPIGQNLSNFWEKQIKVGSPFPNEVLQPANITLKTLIA